VLNAKHFNAALFSDISAPIQVYDPSRSGFFPITVNKRETAPYYDGLRLRIKNLSMLQNPITIDRLLPEIVGASKDLKMLQPSTSFMVVEQSHQWKLLKRKEKDKLSAKDVFEHDESLKTPAPSTWLMLALAVIFLLFFKKRRSMKGLA
ncbi:hypothetical protein BVX99_03025, partial [bacterium F16]